MDAQGELFDACARGDLERAKLLISEAKSAVPILGIINKKDYYGYTLLHYACSTGRAKVVELLISEASGTDKGTIPDILNEKDSCKWTSLHWASQNGHVKAAELLVSEGAIVDEKDSNGRTPLHIASCYGHVKVAELLISYGADYSELIKYYERHGDKKSREELEGIVVEVGMGRVKVM